MEGEMSSEVNILDLPEDCISHILSLTSPGDVCRCATVSTKFRRAAQSDVVWNQFLPSCLEEILSGSVFASKKDLYFQLCGSGILIDGGNNKDPFSQMILSLPNYKPVTSRFSEKPRINDVHELSIQAKIKMRFLSPNTRYVDYFIYVPRFNGIEYPPFSVSVRSRVVGEELTITNYARLEDDFLTRPEYNGYHPRKRDDGWTEVEIGEFFTGDLDHDRDCEVETCLWETGEYVTVACGLVVQGIELRPTED
ncbi:Phloem protein [Trema orientale]|uniref:Phloem protein n=1 Tax=Trema orientale TaxID=63057 RepID=A0A2P5DHW8_TREOI|nr:Phloem protein [Trema orientale]